MSKWLVTGGAGFIGSHIVEKLVASGEDVRVLDDLSTGSLKNMNSFIEKIDFLEGDIRDAAAAKHAARDVDFVLHLAAQGSVPRSIANPDRALDVNVSGTLRILEAARDNGVKRVVLSSSSSVYGKQKVDRQVETLQTKPASPYALSKLSAEHLGRIFTDLYGLEVISLRYFNVFGPRQDPNSQYSAVIPLFVSRLLRGEAVEIHGDGSQSRDFTYVDNVVRANLAAATKSVDHTGVVCNIACGQTTSVADLYYSIRDLLGINAEPKYTERRPGDINYSRANIGRAEEILGWKPHILFNEGISLSIEWYKENIALPQAA